MKSIHIDIMYGEDKSGNDIVRSLGNWLRDYRGCYIHNVRYCQQDYMHETCKIIFDGTNSNEPSTTLTKQYVFDTSIYNSLTCRKEFIRKLISELCSDLNKLDEEKLTLYLRTEFNSWYLSRENFKKSQKGYFEHMLYRGIKELADSGETNFTYECVFGKNPFIQLKKGDKVLHEFIISHQTDKTYYEIVGSVTSKYLDECLKPKKKIVIHSPLTKDEYMNYDDCKKTKADYWRRMVVMDLFNRTGEEKDIELEFELLEDGFEVFLYENDEKLKHYRFTESCAMEWDETARMLANSFTKTKE